MAGPDPKYKLDDPEKILEEYRQTGDAELRNKLVMHYSYIPKGVAVQMRGITGGYAQVEDIVNEGIITLMNCLDKYTQEKGMKFENYVYMRVRNANIDFVRKQDWVPRRVRKTARELSDAYNELSTKLMREPSNQELAQHMGISEEDIQKHLSEMNSGAVLSFEELLQNSVGGDSADLLSAGEDSLPEKGLMQTEMRQKLIEAVDELTERERTIISLYYYEHLKLHEIAEVVNVSESRVSQIHSKAILKMKQTISEYIVN